MIKYKLLKENGFTPKSITKDKSAIIIETENDKYAIKENETNLDKTYKYLNVRGFNYFPNYQIIDNYMIYNYIEDIEEDESQKLEDLIYLISLLHLKTTRYSKIDIDDYKIIYENLDNRINKVTNYYTNLNNEIDSTIYMSPSQYLLVRNISTIYSALNFSKEKLDEYYQLIKQSTSMRKVLIHNNYDLKHLRKNKSLYLINFSKSKIERPIYDLLNIYNNSYNKKDFKYLLNIYESKYPLNKDELYLLFIYISIPEIITFEKDEYKNTLKVKKILDKLYKSDELIRPYFNKKLDNIKK